MDVDDMIGVCEIGVSLVSDTWPRLVHSRAREHAPLIRVDEGAGALVNNARRGIDLSEPGQSYNQTEGEILGCKSLVHSEY